MLIQVVNKKTGENLKIYKEDLSFYQRKGFEVCENEVVRDEVETTPNDEEKTTSEEEISLGEEPIFHKKGRRNRG